MELGFHFGYTEGMEEDTLAALIRRQRKIARLTQSELGDEINISGRQISEWESGRAAPSRESIAALARVFRISADEFLQRLQPLPRDPELDAIIAEELERKKGHGPERMRAAHILEDLIDDPALIEAWLSYGEYLLSRR